VIGVDVHKDVHVAVALAPKGGRLGEHRIPTTRKGYDDLIVWSEEFGSNPVYAIKDISYYYVRLIRAILDAGFPDVEVNRTDRSVRRRLGKDVDAVFRVEVAIDAEAAARAYLAGTATATPKTGADQVEMIRMVKVAKDSATEGKTCAINQIKALLVTAPAALRERLGNLTRRPLIDAFAALRPGVLDGPMAAAKRALRTLARRIQSLQQEIEVLLSDLDSLTKAVCPGLRQTYGVGVDRAAVFDGHILYHLED
jgi:hypothetical protein